MSFQYLNYDEDVYPTIAHIIFSWKCKQYFTYVTGCYNIGNLFSAPWYHPINNLLDIWDPNSTAYNGWKKDEFPCDQTLYIRIYHSDLPPDAFGDIFTECDDELEADKVQYYFNDRKYMKTIYETDTALMMKFIGKYYQEKTE